MIISYNETWLQIGILYNLLTLHFHFSYKLIIQIFNIYIVFYQIINFKINFQINFLSIILMIFLMSFNEWIIEWSWYELQRKVMVLHGLMVLQSIVELSNDQIKFESIRFGLNHIVNLKNAFKSMIYIELN